MKKVLILTDGKAGHENQSKAFARALGYDFDLVEVHFKSVFHKALSYLHDWIGVRSMRLLKGLDGLASAKGTDYAAVIGTGSGTFYAAQSLARQLGVKCGVVLYPGGYRLSSFDCILAPFFDRPKKAANIIEIPANLVVADEAFYAKGIAAYRERTAVDPEIAVIIGGPNKCSTMSVEWVKGRLDEIFRQPGSKAVTTSRRTPPAVEALVDTYPWDYKLLYSKDHFNPIPAFVKLARKLYVTAESTGMLSESCTFGTAEVYALDNLNPGPHKFRRFVEGLEAGGYLKGNRKVDLSASFAAAKQLLGL
ncbi:MAG: ELM1/GtrOC1 family putative glycosyltransferase [Kiritimatiellia bacterium]